MSSLDEEELLQHARSGMTPGADDRERMRARLLTSLAAAGAAGGASAAATSTAAATTTTTAAVTTTTVAVGGVGLTTKVLVLVIGASVAGAVGYATLSPDEAPVEVAAPRAPAPVRETEGATSHGPESSEPAPTVASPEPSQASPEEASTVETSTVETSTVETSTVEASLEEGSPVEASLEEASPVEASPAEARPEAPPRPLPSAPARARSTVPSARSVEPAEARPAAPAPDALREESALIARARAALRRGDASASQRALDEHARRFPAGFLAEERDVQRVQVYCARGDLHEARRLGARFRAEHPSSLHAASMARPCEGPESPAERR